MAWQFDPAKLSGELSAAGYDVDAADAFGGAGDLTAGAPVAGSLTARRERDDAVVEVVVDAGGRLRATVTRALAEDAIGPVTVGGTTLRAVRRRTETVTATGTLSDSRDLTAMLERLAQGWPFAG